MRRGRFRKHLISESDLKKEAETLYPLISDLVAQYELGELKAWEFVGEYILVILKHRHPKLWPGSPHPRPLREGVHFDNCIDTFNLRALRGIPLEAHRALVRWALQEIPLKLMFHVPSATEVLDMQCESRRCVTAVIKKEELSQFVEHERDPLGFVIHDLIHADKFYGDAERLAGQLSFYNDVRTKMKAGAFSLWLNQDPIFEKDFHYVISDMNSHPAHLQQTLEAFIQLAEKRKGTNPLQQVQASESVAKLEL